MLWPPEGSPDALVLEHAPALIAYLDTDLRYRFANRRYGGVVGAEPEEIVGKRVADVLPVYDQVEAYLQGALAWEPQQYEIQVGTPTRWLRTSLVPDRDANGAVRGVFVFVIDIHELRAAEEATRRFRYALDQGVEGFSMHDEEGRFVFANPAEAEIYGYEVDELIGLSWEIQYDEEWREHIQRHCMPALAQNGRWRGELMGRRKNGESFPVLVSLTVLKSEDGASSGLVCTCRDLTEQKLAEASLRHLQKMDAIGKLTGGVAHDFNNLLLVINAELQLALESTGNAEELRESLTNALDATKRASVLTNRLLAFSRKQTLQPRAIDANELVYGMAKLLRRTLGAKVQVKIHATPELWLCRADPNELENVLLNLAINARDAMPDGGELHIRTSNVEPRDDDRDAPAGEYIRVSVEDTGVGMSAETLSQIYDPFFTTKGPGKGSGLGLSMAYGFARQSGGSLSARSEEGKGSVFELMLPRATESRVADEEPLPTRDVDVANSTVLLVEDDETVRRTVAHMLDATGYRVLQATDASSALDILRSDARVDLLLTDVVLGGPQSGPDIGKAAVALRRGLPVVLMSGYLGDNVAGEDLAFPFLRKPFGHRELSAAISGALGKASIDPPAK